MTSNNSSEQFTQNVSELWLRVKTLTQQDEKNARAVLIVKVCLLVFITGYLSWIYTCIKPIDAKMIVTTVKEQIHASLPDAKIKVRQQLTSIAPSVVDEVGDETLRQLPTLARNAENLISIAMIDYTRGFEEEMSLWFKEAIREQQETIKITFPDMSSQEQLNALRDYVIDDTREALKTMNLEIGNNMKRHPFTKQLQYLAQNENLTAKEQLQREVIGLWYILVQRGLQDYGLQ